MDAIDLKILAALRKDARLTHQQLSEQVGLSPTPCARRIRRLEADGIITGYSARINEAKLGFEVSVFVSVKLDQQVDDRLQNFERNVRVFPEVVDCWLMTGTFDYLLRIVVRDLHEFEQFLTGKLTKLPGVASLESSIPIRRVKDEATRID
ncbi:Lrp/AsnC family transcriptional regulator [Pseudaestuariivita atlantica]|uniref:AsnC family transcriptional regulator n=1 Tax=Pseudaestuariivita atlantica TaxID=1317121 RepID=A0A0L1JPJ5_9RHOB|nr:Lrp/AsnC family transcriptional regulator [Pseudaestuariivita atlantica]KNG93637.1 AsnC family transcriptional regulator [Pseudaestuariivita atlantica]